MRIVLFVKQKNMSAVIAGLAVLKTAITAETAHKI